MRSASSASLLQRCAALRPRRRRARPTPRPDSAPLAGFGVVRPALLGVAAPSWPTVESRAALAIGFSGIGLCRRVNPPGRDLTPITPSPGSRRGRRPRARPDHDRSTRRLKRPTAPAPRLRRPALPPPARAYQTDTTREVTSPYGGCDIGFANVGWGTIVVGRVRRAPGVRGDRRPRRLVSRRRSSGERGHLPLGVFVGGLLPQQRVSSSSRSYRRCSVRHGSSAYRCSSSTWDSLACWRS